MLVQLYVNNTHPWEYDRTVSLDHAWISLLKSQSYVKQYSQLLHITSLFLHFFVHIIYRVIIYVIFTPHLTHIHHRLQFSSTADCNLAYHQLKFSQIYSQKCEAMTEIEHFTLICSVDIYNSIYMLCIIQNRK